VNSHQSGPAGADPWSLEPWQRSSFASSTYADQISLMTKDASEALLRSLAVQEGESVLDVACGPGDPSLRLGQCIGRTGMVVSVDAIDTLTRTTAQRAREAGLRLAAVQSRGELLPFASESFDALSCRFGVMFFKNPAHALIEAHRVLRRRGRATYVVWGPRKHNVYFTAPHDALEACGSPPPEVHQETPTPFQFCEQDALASLMRAAGFEQVQEQTCAIRMRFPGLQPRDLLDLQRRISPKIADRLSDLGPAMIEVVRNRLADEIQPWFSEGRLELPGEILLVSGRVAPG